MIVRKSERGREHVIEGQRESESESE